MYSLNTFSCHFFGGHSVLTKSQGAFEWKILKSSSRFCNKTRNPKTDFYAVQIDLKKCAQEKRYSKRRNTCSQLKKTIVQKNIFAKRFLQFPNKMVKKKFMKSAKKDFLIEITFRRDVLTLEFVNGFAFYCKIRNPDFNLNPDFPIGRTQITNSRSLLNRLVFTAHNTV